MILHGLLLLFSSRYHPSPSLSFVCVGGETIQLNTSVRNLGVILDPSADMEDIKLKRYARYVVSI